MDKTYIKRSYLTSVLGCLCPRCRKGFLFKNGVSLGLKRNMEMHATCTCCQQPTDIEVGFYYGTGYVSYLICFFLSILSFLVWWLLIGLSFKDDRFTYWIICNSLFLLAINPGSCVFPGACGSLGLLAMMCTGMIRSHHTQNALTHHK
jgi:hypothetical protein